MIGSGAEWMLNADATMAAASNERRRRRSRVRIMTTLLHKHKSAPSLIRARRITSATETLIHSSAIDSGSFLYLRTQIIFPAASSDVSSRSNHLFISFNQSYFQIHILYSNLH